MYQFIVGIAFELILLIFFVMGYLIADGRLSFPFVQSLKEDGWLDRYRPIIKMTCILTIMLLLADLVLKYIYYQSS